MSRFRECSRCHSSFFSYYYPGKLFIVACILSLLLCGWVVVTTSGGADTASGKFDLLRYSPFQERASVAEARKYSGDRTRFRSHHSPNPKLAYHWTTMPCHLTPGRNSLLLSTPTLQSGEGEE